MTEFVKLPKAMLDHLEEQAVELKELKDLVAEVAVVVAPYQITAIVTQPPSGRDAEKILNAVNRFLAAIRT